MNFIKELQRRNVIRMAGLCLVGAWLITHVAGTVLPMFGEPEWITHSVVSVLALGFVPPLVFAWVFEWTPEGLRRDADVPIEQSIAPLTVRAAAELLGRFFPNALRAPEFADFARHMGLAALWDEFGPPDRCQKVANGDYVCE